MNSTLVSPLTKVNQKSLNLYHNLGLTHSDYQRATRLIPQCWRRNQEEPIHVFLSASNTGKPNCTNKDRLMLTEG